MGRRKKILLGSILAVALLTLVSFSNVVGYQSIGSNDKIDSPLFNMRINKAVNKESNTITNDYLGKDKLLNILLPNRVPYDERINRIIGYIQGMDDIEFQRLVDYVILEAKQNSDFEEYDDEDVSNVLNQIRNNQDISRIKQIFKMINFESDEPNIENLLTSDPNLCADTSHIIVCGVFFIIALVLIIVFSWIWIPLLIILFLWSFNNRHQCSGPL